MIFRDIIKCVDCFEKNQSNSEQCPWKITLYNKKKKSFAYKEMFLLKNGNSITDLVLCTATCS